MKLGHTYTPTPVRGSWWPTVAVLGWLVLVCLVPGRVSADHAQPDVQGAVYAAAQRHHINPEPILRLFECESGFRQHAEGDHRWIEGRFVPTSRGPAQISALPTGLARHFWSLGYTDREDPEQAADYTVRVYAGEFLRYPPPLHPFGIVSIERWSCARKLGIR